MAQAKGRRRKVGRVMHEYKRGTLKSGGRRKVKSRKQAVAIAMSESGQSRNKGKRKASRKKTATKKTSAKKSSRKKATRKTTQKRRAKR